MESRVKISSVWKEKRQLLRLKTYIEKIQEYVKLPPSGEPATLKQA